MHIIIDNNMGNISSVSNALKKLDVNFKVSSSVKDVKSAKSIIFPGVGSFPKAIQNLHNSNLYDAIRLSITKNKIPYLGICLGMQILFEESFENNRTEGMSIFKGSIKRLPDKEKFPVPHVGWNRVKIIKENPLFINIDKRSRFYYDHSFYSPVKDKATFATLQYSVNIVSGINSKNIFGVQFHPEKSQRNGLKLLRNFINFSEQF